MSQYLTPQYIFDTIILLVGVIYAVAQAFNGRSQKQSSEDKDALITLQLKDAAIESLTKEVSRLNTVVIQQGKDVAAIQAQLTGEKEKNASLINILANRDPAFQKFMTDTVETHARILDNIIKLAEAMTILQEKLKQ